MAKEKLFEGAFVTLEIEDEEPVWTLRIEKFEAVADAFDVLSVLNAIASELVTAAMLGNALLSAIYHAAVEEKRKKGDGEDETEVLH